MDTSNLLSLLHLQSSSSKSSVDSLQLRGNRTNSWEPNSLSSKDQIHINSKLLILVSLPNRQSIKREVEALLDIWLQKLTLIGIREDTTVDLSIYLHLVSYCTTCARLLHHLHMVYQHKTTTIRCLLKGLITIGPRKERADLMDTSQRISKTSVPICLEKIQTSVSVWLTLSGTLGLMVLLQPKMKFEPTWQHVK